MKIKLLFLTTILFLVSCKNEARIPYTYEQNPEYTYMGVAFYGQYYKNIPNYVFSFTFLSDGMLSEDGTDIVAPGQYLYIEDLFVPYEQWDILQDGTTDFVLTENMLLNMLKGEYKVSGKVGAEDFGESMTFAPGEYFKTDSATYILGARITYYEEEDHYSTRKLITEGAFTIFEDRITFDLRTDDGLTLKGTYKIPQEQTEKKITVKYSSKRQLEELK